jgi:hypothetical protein
MVETDDEHRGAQHVRKKNELLTAVRSHLECADTQHRLEQTELGLAPGG